MSSKAPSHLISWLLAVTLLVGFNAAPAAAQQLEGEDAPALVQNLEGLRDADDTEADAILGDASFRRRGGDDFKSPKAAERQRRRQEAIKQRLTGKKGAGKVHQVAKGQFVELGLERNDRVFVILVEYGEKASTNPAVPSAAGPLHNQIPQPDRATNNTTIWQADYNREHYVDMYFNRMVHYYKTQSSGRYTINGDVTEWVKVPFNGPRYGSNTMGDAGAWTLIADAVNLWTKEQLASGKTLAEVTAYLKTFDQWDRYDYNNNGNFDEPDGYIDHFQIVHSGAGEETGGGALGANAIWSHRWQAWYNYAGFTGPAFNRDGGIEIGGGWGANPSGAVTSSAAALVYPFSTANPSAATVTSAHPATPTGVWVGDYTIQPENGGLGVFAHEYGHDLGLPDHYDTNGGSNATGFWTVMSSGSYLGDGGDEIGQGPGDFGAWDKLQLGWLNYDEAQAGVASTHKLGPAETNTKKAQALIVNLPAEKNIFHLYDPATLKLPYGANAWWGGKADNLDATMTRSVAVPAGASALTMRLNYAIEANWDYAYVSVSTNDGATWTNLAGTYAGANGAPVALTTNTNPNGNNLGNGITGASGAAWRLASFNMTPYAGQTVLVRLRYKTDQFTTLNGFLADEITLGPFGDGAEAGDNGWTLSGFKATNGVENSNAPHFYIAEFRQYRDYDKGLQTGPYSGGPAATPNYYTHYPYQDGLLVWYWDGDQANNNTSQHRGEGRVLPVDAHPEPLMRNVQFPGQAPFLSPWSSTVQTYDSTFGLEPTDPITLPYAGTAGGTLYQFYESHPSLPGVQEFNDLNSYWFASKPDASVILPKTGTTIRVVNTSAQGTMMQVKVGVAQ